MREYIHNDEDKRKAQSFAHDIAFLRPLAMAKKFSALMQYDIFLENNHFKLTDNFKLEFRIATNKVEKQLIFYKGVQIRQASIEANNDLQSIPSLKIAEFLYKYTP